MLSRIIRRTHMYLALFLSPWMLIYALSTMAMNHREFFVEKYGTGPPPFEKEREENYPAAFPSDAKPQQVAEQILGDLNLAGRFNVSGPSREGRITIVRQHPLAPRRVIYTPADGKLVIEKQVFRSPAFLERLHRRAGFHEGLPLENAWASSVDLVIIAMVFWVASGVWMWWEMRATRIWGAVAAASGLGLFALFLLTI